MILRTEIDVEARRLYRIANKETLIYSSVKNFDRISRLLSSLKSVKTRKSDVLSMTNPLKYGR